MLSFVFGYFLISFLLLIMVCIFQKNRYWINTNNPKEVLIVFFALPLLIVTISLAYFLSFVCKFIEKNMD